MKIKTYIFQNAFLKVMSLNSVAVLVKMVTAMVSMKAIAVWLGPSAMPLLGNFKNFIGLVRQLSMLGFEQGIVKYVAENEKKPSVLQKVLVTSLLPLFVLSIFIGLLLVLLANWLSKWVFQSPDYFLVFVVFGIALPMYVVNVYLISVLTGFQSFKKVVFVNVVSSLVGLVVTLWLTYQFSTNGALIALAVVESLIVLVTILMIRKKHSFSFKMVDFDWAILKGLSSFSFMTLLTAILSPLVLILIRTEIISKVGVLEAGYWETVQRLSNYYLMVVISGASLYLMPKIAGCKDKAMFKLLENQYLKSIVPLAIILFGAMYVCRNWMVGFLFSNLFLKVSTYLGWQFFGDFLKIVSFVYALPLLVKQQLKFFVISEIVYFLVYAGMFYVMLPIYQMYAAYYAYVIAYLVYFILVYSFNRNIKFNETNNSNIVVQS